MSAHVCLGVEQCQECAVCILEICEEPADAGKWCRTHWAEMFARDIAIERGKHSDESAARTIVTLRRQLEFLGEHTEATYTFCTCGHMVVVHSFGGCHGLSRNGSDEYGTNWTSCKCLQWNENTQ